MQLVVDTIVLASEKHLIQLLAPLCSLKVTPAGPMSQVQQT